jgi:hypothetical protein
MPVVAKTLRPRPEPKSTISGRTLADEYSQNKIHCQQKSMLKISTIFVDNCGFLT